MLKRLKTVRRKKDKSKSEEVSLRRSKSNTELDDPPLKRKSHKRTKSSQSSQTDFGLIEVNQLSNSEPRLTTAGLAETEIKVAEKESEVPERTSQLHPGYICVLLILVGFNFAAFTTYYANSTIPFYKMVLSLLGGVSVALFLRKFIGLNLFKTQDKVSERAVLTIVTQIRLVYKFLMADYEGHDYSEFLWSFFLFNLSIWILFLDKITTTAFQKLRVKPIRFFKLD